MAKLAKCIRIKCVIADSISMLLRACRGLLRPQRRLLSTSVSPDPSLDLSPGARVGPRGEWTVAGARDVRELNVRAVELQHGCGAK